MVEVAIEVTILMCLLILPLFGPPKQGKKPRRRLVRDNTPSDYGINEDGGLEFLKRDDTTE